MRHVRLKSGAKAQAVEDWPHSFNGNGMNYEKLFEAEATFLQAYPAGFEDPELKPIRKKHNVGKLIAFTQDNLTKANCNRPDFIVDVLYKVVSRSSMVSRFEKPPFKQFLEALSSDDKKALAYAVEQRLFGRKQQGFERMLAMLAHHKLAKWAVISAVPFYYAPRREVFVKPTTVKRILTYLEVEDLRYASTPSWAFYSGYRDVLAEVRKRVNPSLSPNYAALSGFLMMSV